MKQIFRVWWLVFTLASILQMILWPEAENIRCVLLAWASCMATGLLILCSRVTVFYPWSSLMVLMFCLQTSGLPLVLLLLQGVPLTRNLEVPLITFTHLLICQIMLLLVHAGYRNMKIWRQFQNGFRLKLLSPLGLLESPGWTEMLAMGAVGLTASAYVYIILNDQNGGGVAITGSVGDKFVQGLIPLSFAPFLAVLPSDANQNRKNLLSRLSFATLYSLPILFIALAYNTRSFIFLGVAIAGCSMLLLLLCGKIRLVLKQGFIFGFIGLLILSTIGSDFAIAMRVARNDRANGSALDIAENTLKLLIIDRRELKNLRNEMRQGSDLSEAWYVTSPSLSRLVDTHFQDRALAVGINLGEGQKDWLRQVEIEHTLVTLPNPILQTFGLGVDKSDVNVGGCSIGAWMLYLGGASGDSGQKSVFMDPNGKLVGDTYATGGFIGDGYAAYGWAYLVPFGGVAFLLFLFSDSLYGFVRLSIHENPSLQTHFAMVGMVNGFALVTALTTESISGLVSFVLRQPLQWLVVYGVVFWGCRFASRTLFGNHSAVLLPKSMP